MSPRLEKRIIEFSQRTKILLKRSDDFISKRDRIVARWKNIMKNMDKMSLLSKNKLLEKLKQN